MRPRSGHRPALPPPAAAERLSEPPAAPRTAATYRRARQSSYSRFVIPAWKPEFSAIEPDPPARRGNACVAPASPLQDTLAQTFVIPAEPVPTKAGSGNPPIMEPRGGWDSLSHRRVWPALARVSLPGGGLGWGGFEARAWDVDRRSKRLPTRTRSVTPPVSRELREDSGLADPTDVPGSLACRAVESLVGGPQLAIERFGQS